MEYFPLTGGCLRWEVPCVRCGNCGYPSYDAAAWFAWNEGECWSCWISRNASELNRDELERQRENLLGVLDAWIAVGAATKGG